MLQRAHLAMSDTMPGTGQCWDEDRKLCAAASVATSPVLASRPKYLIRYLRRQARNLRCDSSMPLPAVRCGCRPHDDSSPSAELAPSPALDVPSASVPAAFVNCMGRNCFQPNHFMPIQSVGILQRAKMLPKRLSCHMWYIHICIFYPQVQL